LGLWALGERPWLSFTKWVNSLPAQVAHRFAAGALQVPRSDRWSLTPADGNFELTIDGPMDRSAVVSAGSALFSAVLGLRSVGASADVRTFPDPLRPDLAATVRITPDQSQPDRGEALLIDAADHGVAALAASAQADTEGVLTLLRRAVATEGCSVRVLRSGEAAAVSQLLSHGHDPDVALRGARGDHIDGLPDKLGAAPLVVVVGADADSPTDWLHAGRAMGHLNLSALACGLDGTVLCPTSEQCSHGAHLRNYLGFVGYPQVVLALSAEAQHLRSLSLVSEWERLGQSSVPASVSYR
jgi:hypothetical protein